MVNTKFNKKISILRCDNGREYTSNNFRDYCKKNGTVIDYTIPYTPQQNGKAERFNRTLVDKARSMIRDSGLSREFWGEAVRTATYLSNRSPSVNLPGLTSAEIWYERKPNVRNLKVFGSLAYVHIVKELRSKFDPKAIKCIMVGYANNGYRVWNPMNNKIVVANK